MRAIRGVVIAAMVCVAPSLSHTIENVDEAEPRAFESDGASLVHADFLWSQAKEDGEAAEKLKAAGEFIESVAEMVKKPDAKGAGEALVAAGELTAMLAGAQAVAAAMVVGGSLLQVFGSGDDDSGEEDSGPSNRAIVDAMKQGFDGINMQLSGLVESIEFGVDEMRRVNGYYQQYASYLAAAQDDSSDLDDAKKVAINAAQSLYHLRWVYYSEDNVRKLLQQAMQVSSMEHAYHVYRQVITSRAELQALAFHAQIYQHDHIDGIAKEVCEQLHEDVRHYQQILLDLNVPASLDDLSDYRRSKHHKHFERVAHGRHGRAIAADEECVFSIEIHSIWRECKGQNMWQLAVFPKDWELSGLAVDKDYAYTSRGSFFYQVPRSANNGSLRVRWGHSNSFFLKVLRIAVDEEYVFFLAQIRPYTLFECHEVNSPCYTVCKFPKSAFFQYRGCYIAFFEDVEFLKSWSSRHPQPPALAVDEEHVYVVDQRHQVLRVSKRYHRRDPVRFVDRHAKQIQVNEEYMFILGLDNSIWRAQKGKNKWHRVADGGKKNFQMMTIDKNYAYTLGHDQFIYRVALNADRWDETVQYHRTRMQMKNELGAKGALLEKQSVNPIFFVLLFLLASAATLCMTLKPRVRTRTMSSLHGQCLLDEHSTPEGAAGKW